jgi:hypothetical protein
MIEMNNEKYSEWFYKMCENQLKNFECIGDWKWGNPAGISDEQPTYEISAKNGTVWCSLVEWLESGSGTVNRCGITATLPSEKRQSLGQIVDITIPYFFSRRFNTRAFKDGNHIEIRNYGKFTVGRAGLKKQDFFDYVNSVDSERIEIDEEGKEYIVVFDIYDDLSSDDFAEQLVKFTILIRDFKLQYRS